MLRWEIHRKRNCLTMIEFVKLSHLSSNNTVTVLHCIYILLLTTMLFQVFIKSISHLPKEEAKLLIGDAKSGHVSSFILDLCREWNVRYLLYLLSNASYNVATCFIYCFSYVRKAVILTLQIFIYIISKVYWSSIVSYLCIYALAVLLQLSMFQHDIYLLQKYLNMGAYGR